MIAEQFLCLADGLPEIMILASMDAKIVATNKAAGNHLGVVASTLHGRSLCDLTDNPKEEILKYLRLCSRTRTPLPLSLKWRGVQETDRARLQGFLLRGCGADKQSLVVIRQSPASTSVSEFRALNRQIEKQQALLRELQQSRATLESRVIERTHDLTQANTTLQDTIATLRETQNQLVQAEKMASLGSLVAGISHEINTPIGVGVTSATSLLEETERLHAAFQSGSMKRSTLEQFIDHAEQSCGILLRNLRRAWELIGNFKQVAVDQSSDDWRVVNLHDYVDDTLMSLKPQWKHSPIQVTNECAPDISIYTNPGAIYQILSNLVMNSLTHAFDAGQAGNIRIVANKGTREVYLRYLDDGKGIPEEHLARVFDPFFTTKRGSGGSGLGLHIVYNLVIGTLNGKITVESRPSQGSAFCVVLPIQDEENNK